MKTFFNNNPYLKYLHKGENESTRKPAPVKTIRHEFVQTIPDVLEDDTLYISLKYNTMIHKCACGCGEEVVTKLSPTDWNFTYDGSTISVYPSIGNWNYDCKSHYWIRRSQIIWAERWSDDKIRRAREHEQLVQERKKER
jgi:hypothetical protein